MQTRQSNSDEWFYPYDVATFECCGKNCTVVIPNEVAEGRPWIWRARFLGAFPYVDQAMLAKGYHIAFINTADMFGSPAAMEIWDKFYELVMRKFDLPAKMTLEGFSRGGLFVYNWAARHPETVNCIYADAPVCDIRSWPAGKGNGPGVEECWETCKKMYGLTEETAAGFDRNPIDILEPIAKAKIPVLHVCGDADEVVPIEENTHVLIERYKKLGGQIELINKPGVLHHPHSLENPQPIVEFIMKNS